VAGSLMRQRSTNELTSADQSDARVSFGDGLDEMRKRARIVGLTCEWGGTSSAISITVMPSDQMSVDLPYDPDSMSSGDIHSGVPMTVERFVWLEMEADTPRSHSLMPPPPARVISTLPALMSRWRMLLSW